MSSSCNLNLNAVMASRSFYRISTLKADSWHEFNSSWNDLVTHTQTRTRAHTHLSDQHLFLSWSKDTGVVKAVGCVPCKVCPVAVYRPSSCSLTGKGWNHWKLCKSKILDALSIVQGYPPPSWILVVIRIERLSNQLHIIYVSILMLLLLWKNLKLMKR